MTLSGALLSQKIQKVKKVSVVNNYPDDMPGLPLEKEPPCRCERCGQGIWPGEYKYTISGHVFCDDCVFDMKPDEWMKFCDDADYEIV